MIIREEKELDRINISIIGTIRDYSEVKNGLYAKKPIDEDRAEKLLEFFMPSYWEEVANELKGFFSVDFIELESFSWNKLDGVFHAYYTKFSNPFLDDYHLQKKLNQILKMSEPKEFGNITFNITSVYVEKI